MGIKKVFSSVEKVISKIYSHFSISAIFGEFGVFVIFAKNNILGMLFYLWD